MKTAYHCIKYVDGFCIDIHSTVSAKLSSQIPKLRNIDFIFIG